VENYNQFKEEMFSRQIEKEKEDILKFNDSIIEFVNYSVMEENVNVILIYGKTDGKCFNHIYRMAIYPFDTMTSVYRNGNAIDCEAYDIQNVKDMAKVYLNYYINNIK
jgi:hypothetical protein